VARTGNGFTPASREKKLFRRFKNLETAQCPFANLPEAKSKDLEKMRVNQGQDL
jgi:hypothetical protein